MSDPILNQNLNQQEKEWMEQATALAAHIMQLAADSIMVNLRFLDLAASALKPEARPGLMGAATDLSKLYYDPIWLLKHYKKESSYALRLYLHVLFHCIFYHSFQYGKMDTELWDISVDLAVENTILELNLHGSALESDDRLRDAIKDLSDGINGKKKKDDYMEKVAWNQGIVKHHKKKKQIPFTAEHIYRYLREAGLQPEELSEYVALSHMDDHIYWNVTEEITIGEEQFKKISERIKADLKSFSKGKTNSESLEKNLVEATKERFDYGDILKRFTVMGEDVAVNEDEFDYIYYTYGLEHYGNMPLIEPLEYKDVKKIREFVIVLDTSASCRGKIIQSFLKKTYGILMQSENFFSKINVHILQCDNEVQSDTRITGQEEFEQFLKGGKLQGFGSTDFRPAFEYTEKMIENGEFDNLKGMIYFTDGFGVYPERMPGFDTIFVFLGEDDTRPALPVWAIGVVLEEEDIEEDIEENIEDIEKEESEEAN